MFEKNDQDLTFVHKYIWFSISEQIIIVLKKVRLEKGYGISSILDNILKNLIQSKEVK